MDRRKRLGCILWVVLLITLLATLFVIVAFGGDTLVSLLMALLTFLAFAGLMVFYEHRRGRVGDLGPDSTRSADAVREGRIKVREIEAAAKGITTEKERATIARICETARAILTECERDPGDVATARTFLTYYLDAALAIVRRYAELAALPVDDPEMRQTLGEAERALDVLEQAFGRQLAAVKADESLDLEAEVELLNKTVQMDDLYTQTGGQQ